MGIGELLAGFIRSTGGLSFMLAFGLAANGAPWWVFIPLVIYSIAVL